MYRIGQKIICIHDTGWSPFFSKNVICPKKDQIYTIRSIRESIDYPNQIGFLLYEIYNHYKVHSSIGIVEPGFLSKRFRPVVEDESKTDISFAINILKQKQKQKETVQCSDVARRLFV